VEHWCASEKCCVSSVDEDNFVGLYTSPHLVAVRERIRINGTPISEEQFAKFFFQVWDRLDQTLAEVKFSCLLIKFKMFTQFTAKTSKAKAGIF
jgi:folylpolyglutamate synthase/dihydropteroate synthase